jgi:hypothetical protein
MMIVREGEKKYVAVKIVRTRGTGVWTATTPQARTLGSTRALVPGHDWLPCSWDDTEDELYILFDSTLSELSAVGTYYVQFRCTIGVERYEAEVIVRVIEVGP